MNFGTLGTGFGGMGRGGAGAADTPTAEFEFSLGLMDPRITYTHTNSNRWGFNSSGLLVNFAATVPNFDYGAMGGGSLRGIRLDTTTTMPLLQNRDFSNAAWTKTNVTAAKDAVGLDGSANSCSTLTATSNGGKVTQSVTLSSALRCFYVYMKRKTGTGAVSLTADDGSTSTDITSQINSSTFTLVKISQTLANPVFGVIFATSGDEVIVDCASIDVSCGNIPTTPIITAGSSVQRVRDDLTITSTNFTDWFNATEGTFVAEFILDYASDASTNASRILFQLDDTTQNSRYSVYAASTVASNNVYASVFTSTVQQASINFGSKASAGILQKVAFAYAANDCQLAANGSTAAADTSVTLPTVTRLVIGGRVGSNEHLTGALKRLQYWNRRRPQAELATITAL